MARSSGTSPRAAKRWAQVASPARRRASHRRSAAAGGSATAAALTRWKSAWWQGPFRLGGLMAWLDPGYVTAKLRRVPQRWGVPPDLAPGERGLAR